MAITTRSGVVRRQVAVLLQIARTSAGFATVGAATAAVAFTVTVALTCIHPCCLWIKVLVLIAAAVL